MSYIKFNFMHNEIGFLRINSDIAERSKACTVYDSLNIEIAGSNTARGMDVCLHVSVLCCPVFR
jgi:hypothetical protein